MNSNNTKNIEWFDHLAVAAFIIDDKNTVIKWNRACELLTGVKKDEVVGTSDHWRGFYDHPRDCLADLALSINWQKKSDLYATVSEFSPDGNSLKAENWCQTPSGLKYLLFEANKIIDEEGKLIGAIETLRDITDRKAIETRNTIAIDNNPAAIYLLELNKKNGGYLSLINVSDGFCELTGYERAECLLDKNFFLENIHPDDKENVINARKKIKTSKDKKLAFEYRFNLKNMGYHWIHEEMVKIEVDTFNNEHVLGVWLDVDDRKKNEAELKKLHSAVNQSSSTVIITDIDGIIEYVNPQFEKLTGYSADEMLGNNVKLLNAKDNDKSLFSDLIHQISEDNVWLGELHCKRKDGEFYWCRLSISGIRDEDNEISHYISIQEDVTAEYNLSKQLDYQAKHDSLTGLVNRNEFERRLKRLLSSMQENSLHALCYLDLDQFKVVNDTCGHVAGDELLRQITHLLKDKVRIRDTLARIGGDEFIVLMEHCSLSNANRVAKQIKDTISEFRFIWDNKPFNVGASIGLVQITQENNDFNEILKYADTACYMAKNLGRNRIQVYTPDDENMGKLHGEMQWVEKINKALVEQRLVLHAQPITGITPKYKKHIFYEVLIRMKDEDGKLIMPNLFLPAAERYNISEKIDNWVITSVLEIITDAQDKLNDDWMFFINLSGHSIANDDFQTEIILKIKESNINPKLICFEITETAAIGNLTSAVSFISNLKKLGCSIALDDFGSGVSSFGYLKNLNVDYLKIDGQFVRDMLTDEIDFAMVKSIHDLGKVMGKLTIAEHVNNDKITPKLKKIGVNYAQGYALAKPKSLKKLVR